jgi:hypothetical protein
VFLIKILLDKILSLRIRLFFIEKIVSILLRIRDLILNFFLIFFIAYLIIFFKWNILVGKNIFFLLYIIIKDNFFFILLRAIRG